MSEKEEMRSVVTVDCAKILEKLKSISTNAYAPYSKFFVGAAIKDFQGNVFFGVNYENSSYGATICAERNAVGTMVTSGSYEIQEVWIMTSVTQGCPPCGLCLQVMSEFVKDPQSVKIHLVNLDGKVVDTKNIQEYMPHVFTQKHLG